MIALSMFEYWMYGIVCISMAGFMRSEEVEKPISKDECLSDVGFIMDMSGSVGENWKHEKTFVKRLVKTMNVSPRGGHAAITAFSSHAELMIKFSDHTTTPGFEAAVDALPFWGGDTRIESALQVAHDEMFQKSNGMRSTTSKKLILITDGQQTGVKYSQWATTFRIAQIKRIVVGIGNVSRADLRDLVDFKSDLHIAETFEGLLSANFMRRFSLCDGGKEDVEEHVPKVDVALSCTEWHNSADCDANGDWETVSNVNGILTAMIDCPSSYIIQAKSNDTVLYNAAHTLGVTGDRVTFSYKYPPHDITGAGLVCDNRGYTWANDGPAQECKDYSVRFCCPNANAKILKEYEALPGDLSGNATTISSPIQSLNISLNATCPKNVKWGDTSVSCDSHCKKLFYAAGHLIDKPRRCRCREFSDKCRADSVKQVTSNGKLSCFYDVCALYWEREYQCKVYEYSKNVGASCGVNGHLPTKYTNAQDAQIACDNMRKLHGNCSTILDQTCTGHNNAGIACYTHARYGSFTQNCSPDGFNSGNFYLCKEPVKMEASTSACIYFRGA